MQFPRVLCVEGRSELHVVLGLLDLNPQIRPFRVLVKPGFGGVIKSIGPEIKVRDRLRVGFVMDANADLRARWEQAQERIRAAGISVPCNPDPMGTIVSGSQMPRVGVWLMPDNCTPGELEDYLIQSIPQGDPVWPLSKEYVANVDEQVRRIDPTKVNKSRLNAWMAVRNRPGYLRDAIRDRELDIGREGCRNFVSWIQRLMS